MSARDDEEKSPFLLRLEDAAARLQALADRSSPLIVVSIRKEVVAVREAARELEGVECSRCLGRGTLSGKSCTWCGGRGDW